jgi:uncharacterized membrane protein
MTLPSGSPQPHDLPLPGQQPPSTVSATVRVVICLAAGVVVGAAVGVPGTWRLGLLVGWMVAAAVFVTWMWTSIWPMDAQQTASYALKEDPGRALSDTMILGAAVASLIAVALLLLGKSSGPVTRNMQAALSVASVALGWAAVHTIFTTRYARHYYEGSDGGINFNEPDPPCYADFAYVAFTVGMTFQVSDTDIETKAIRKTLLNHALLSYLFGTVVIATTINLVAGLGH